MDSADVKPEFSKSTGNRRCGPCLFWPVILAILFLVGALIVIIYYSFEDNNQGFPQVTWDSRHLYVNGMRLFLRGVNWSPVPIGVHASRFGYTYATTQELYRLAEQDAPVMAAGGFNAVKVFASYTDPSYMQALYDHGVWTIAGPQETQSVEEVIALVEEYGKQPGLLMWVVGQNWIYSDRYEGAFSSYREAADHINRTCNLIKRYDPHRRPVSSVYGDFSSTGIQFYDRMSCIDVWGTNIYAALRNHSYVPGDGFDGRLELSRSQHPEKPMIVGEYGIDAFNAYLGRPALEDHALAIATLSSAIAWQHRDFAGGFVFEWQDEWWKEQRFVPDSPNVSTQENGGWDPRMFGDGLCSPQCLSTPGDVCSCWYSEEWWGLVDARRNYSCLPLGEYRPGCSLRPAFFAYSSAEPEPDDVIGDTDLDDDMGSGF